MAALSAGSNFLLDSGRSRRSFQVPSTSRVYSLRSLNLPFSVDFVDLIGSPYGATLEIEEKEIISGQEKLFSLVRKRRCAAVEESDNPPGTADLLSAGPCSTVFSDPAFLPQADNSNIFQDSAAQSMSTQDIEALKGAVKPLAVVERLVQGSATFQQKTEFSQEKYIRKKKKKYGCELRLLDPDYPINIIETFQLKDSSRIFNLRPDSAAEILSLANVRSGGRLMVHEQNSIGILTNLALQRMGGSGFLLSVNSGPGASFEAIRRSNLTEEQTAPLHSVAFDHLTTGEAAASSTFHAALLASGFDSLIISTRLDCFHVFFSLFRHLSPSGAFVVHSQFIEPLAALQEKLRLGGLACSVQLSESWCREYQILPNRTHPHVSMNSNSGYTLAGYKIAMP